MANTIYLKTEIESFVRKWLKENYGKEFEEQEIPLKLETGGVHRFDAVSKDRTIVAGIKASALRNSGTVGVGTIKSAYTELYFLSLIKADLKLLVLTDPGFYELFLRRSEGKVKPDTKIVHSFLPEDLVTGAAKVSLGSRNEIGKLSQVN